MMLPGHGRDGSAPSGKGTQSELPVVFITAHADARGAVKAIKAGAHDYLSKPFDNHEVIRVVHRAFEQDIKVKVRQLLSQISNLPLKEKMGRATPWPASFRK